jgi:hypothetical protein
MSDTKTLLLQTIETLGASELDVLLGLANRLSVGQRQYGLLDPNDGRDWKKEQKAEVEDLLVYHAIRWLVEESK